jgi:beta-lactamase class A
MSGGDIAQPRRCARRQLVLGAVASFTTACAPRILAPTARSTESGETPKPPPQTIADIHARVGGRVGVFALDTGTERQVAYRADDRYPMCSTFKWVLAAAILARVDRAELSLDERLSFTPADLDEHAPVTRAHVAEGSMTIVALTEAALLVSDNTAANLLLPKIGGPAGFTQLVRALGDTVTRLDRNQPTVNSNEPLGDPRDTTSPRAMVGLMRRVLCGDVLSSGSRERLLGWLRATQTGKNRLRAGLPPSWIVGDKTGSGGHCVVNDVAIAWPPGHDGGHPHAPGRAPILIAAYMCDGEAGLDGPLPAHAHVARLVARELSTAL